MDCKLEITIDRILISAQDLKKKLTTIKQCGQSDDDANKPFASNMKDAKRIRDLQRENIELRQALEDYQYGLEFIMSKYRSQVVELIQLNRMEKNTPAINEPQVNHESA